MREDARYDGMISETGLVVKKIRLDVSGVRVRFSGGQGIFTDCNNVVTASIEQIEPRRDGYLTFCSDTLGGKNKDAQCLAGD